jgi:MFS transporter, SHS family, lactate transporter
VTEALFLTLAMRPVGALIFGRLADMFGRRPTLMVNVLIYSLIELASGFAPSLAVLLALRALFGVAMGGEWGVGSSLVMESIPAKSRGVVSGLLQAGYPSGFLLAFFVFRFHDALGWRHMFMIGVLPALLVLFIRRNVPESPAWKVMSSRPRPSFLQTLRTNFKLSIYAIVLMTAFNFFSHGTQDLYPTFLNVQMKLPPAIASNIGIVLNIGAIVGGISFGFISERIGRRKAILIAALIALPVLPLWAFSSTVIGIALGAFLMQISVQGAWGVIPVHLNEISPDVIRATFPGLVYQLGNLLASRNGPMQAAFAEAHGNNYAFALAVVAAAACIAISVLIMFGPERRGVDLVESARSASTA